MQVILSQREGKCGDRVSIRVKPEDPAQVTRVHASVDYDFDFTLNRDGNEWTGEQTIPYEAGPGVYHVTFRAYDSTARSIDTAQETFTVVN